MWVEAEHSDVTLTGDGCFNPYAQQSIMSQGGELAQLKLQTNISGCVPQASTYPSLRTWSCSTAAQGGRFRETDFWCNETCLLSTVFLMTALHTRNSRAVSRPGHLWYACHLN